MIKPTVGRVVWFMRGQCDEIEQRDQPLAAIVTYVWNDSMVNLTVFDANGVPHARTSVPLEQGDTRPSAGFYCEWMPYQKGQAAKTEALERKVADNVPQNSQAFIDKTNAEYDLKFK